MESLEPAKPPAWANGLAEDGLETEKRETDRHALRSSVCTLCLAIAGSSVLPIPHSFSQTGLVPGIAALVVVALVNYYTSCIIIDCAHISGLYSYEELAQRAFGPKFRIFTQWSLLLLLFGNLCGSLSALGEVASIAVRSAMLPRDVEEMLTREHAQVLLTIITVLVVFPLSMLRKMRQLEVFGAGGFFVLLLLIGVTGTSAIEKGMPAIRSGDFSLFKLRRDASEALGVFGFAFYLQPLILPLLREMPRGKRGVKVTKSALGISIFAFALVLYMIVGIFGAARFGQKTMGNILENFQSKAMSIVDWLVTLYLAFSFPTIHFSLRCSLDTLIAGDGASFSWARHTSETILAVGSTLVVSLFFNKGSNAMFAITGSSAVCVVCYVMPVVFHLRLRNQATMAENLGLLDVQAVREPILPSGGATKDAAREGRAGCEELMRETLVPVFAVIVGVGISIVSLVTTIRQF